MPLTYLERTADVAPVTDALRRDGAVVVTGLAEPALIDTVAAELRPQLDASGLDTCSDFNGSKTLRTGAVLTAAPSAAALVDHDLVVGVANEILLPYCATYQVGSASDVEAQAGV